MISMHPLTKHCGLLILLCACFYSLPSFSQDKNNAVSYSFPVTDRSNIPVQCGIHSSIPGVGKFAHALSPANQIVKFDFKPEQNKNYKISIKGGEVEYGGYTLPPCSLAGDIYVNQIIKYEWDTVLSGMKRQSEKIFNCFNIGLDFLKININVSPDTQELIMRPSDSKADELYNFCQQMQAINLKKNYSCDLPGGQGQSMCDQDLFSPKQNKRLNFDEAIVAALSGDEVTIKDRENEVAEKDRMLRLQRAKEERDRNEKIIQEAKEREDQKKLAQLEASKKAQEERDRVLAEQRERDEKYRQWLETPEGKKHQAEEAAKAKRQAEQLEKEFPYYAVISCGMGSHLNILACFVGSNGVDTEMKLTNNGKSGMYKAYNFKQSGGQEMKDGYHIPLSKNYSIKIQNSHKTLILELKIVDRKTGKIVFQDQASQFGVIIAQN